MCTASGGIVKFCLHAYMPVVSFLIVVEPCVYREIPRRSRIDETRGTLKKVNIYPLSHATNAV